MPSFLVTIRRLREDRLAAIGLALLVLVTAFAFGSAPRLLDLAADSAIRGTVREAIAPVRNVALVEEQRLPVRRADPLEAVTEEGDRLEAAIPEGLRAVLGERLLVVDSPRWRVTAFTPDPTFVRFRVQPGVAERVRFVAGRPPTAETETIPLEPPPDPGAPPDPGGRQPQTELVVTEVAISAATAEVLGYGIGDDVPLVVDAQDPLVGQGHEWRTVIRITGLFEVTDPADPFWYEDPALERPAVRSVGDQRLQDATALLDPAAYAALMEVTGPEHLPVRYSWRFPVLIDQLESEAAASLVADLRRLETLYPPLASFGRTSAAATRSGLLPLVQEHERRWGSAFAILTVTAVGPAAVAAAALALVAILVARRRRPALAIVRGRGASLGQVIRAVALEGAVLAIPATALALVAAIALLPAGPNRATIAAAAAVAVLAIVLLVLTALPGTAATTSGAAERGRGGRGPGPRRLVFEVLVIGLAVVGAQLLRERGIRGESSADALAGADPLIAAVPTLVGVAVGLAAIRLVPLPLGLLARLAGAGRGLVPVLALRRATHGGTTAAILVVLLATAAIGAFSAAALTHLEGAAEAVAWQRVGAPFGVTTIGGSLPRDLDLDALPGVEATATGQRTTVTIGGRNLRVELLLLDTEAYAAVTAGTSAAPGFPAAMLRPGAPGVAVLPAIVSTEVANRPDGLAIGRQAAITLDGYPATIEAVEARDSFPSLPAGGLFVVASRDQLRAIHPTAPVAPTVAFLRAPDDAGSAIRSRIAELSPIVRVAGRAELAASLRDSPITAAIRAGIAVAALVAVAYAALAVASALALAGSARAVEVAHLRTLGLSRRESLGLVVVEHGPTVLLSFVIGVALGLGLFAVLRPGLGLDALVGSRLDIPVGIGPDRLGLIGLAVVGIVAGGIVLAAVAQRRAGPVAALRRGVE